MPTLPRSTTTVDQTAGGSGAGANLIAVIAPVPLNADGVARQYGSASGIFTRHGYSEGLEYADLHLAETALPILFCGIPIATLGAISVENTTGNSGTCVTTLTAGADGVLHEHDGVVTVLTGGTVGVSTTIALGLSLDGGRTVKRVRLGTATSYVMPFIGVTLTLRSGGTLIAGETIHTWHGSQPRGDADGFALARASLAAQPRGVRTWLVVGDAPDATYAAAVLTQVNAYATSNERFVKARVQVYDHARPVVQSKVLAKTSATDVTFAEVGVTGDTITRLTGSFVTDGFVVGDMLTVAGTPSGSNNFTGVSPITAVSALVLTLGTDDLVAQGPVAATISAQGSLVFDNLAETITRNRGSWIADGFAIGQSVTISGTASNNGTSTVTAVSATVLTLSAGGVPANETIGMNVPTVSASVTKLQHAADVEPVFSSIDSAYRISLVLGRARKTSSFSGWFYRRPAQWAVSVREYQHDYHVATWKKDNGALAGWSLSDANGNLVELDDRVDGAVGISARFTTLRSWANGPGGVFVALDLTRADDSTILSYCHNVDVVNLAETVVHRSTENMIGSTLVLKEDGSGQATTDSLNTIKARVNTDLARSVLTDIGEGVRASGAVWTPDADTDLSGAEALLTGTLVLTLNGTIHSVRTAIKVQ